MTRTILITGCSSGIGYAAATALRARDWTVVAACRKAEDMARLEAEGFATVQLDHGNPESVSEGFKAAMAHTDGRLDALFNNGGHGLPAAAEDVPRAALEHVFHSNLFGVHDVTCRAIPIMRAQGHGRIIQHSSVVGFTALKWRSAYVATKHAMEGLTKTMRLELRGSGIHVSLLNTGPVTSGFRENSSAEFDRWIDPENSVHAEAYRTRLTERHGPKSTPDPFELPATAVVEKLVHALEARRPKRRYYITAPSYIAAFGTRVLPEAAQDWILSKV